MKQDKDAKALELKKYMALVMATIDYTLDAMEQTPALMNQLSSHFESMKAQAEEHFKRGRLTVLKQWFRDLTEGQIETRDFKFNQYLRDKTGYDVDIFESYFQRINKIIQRGKIVSVNEFYDCNMMVNELSQTQPLDEEKIATLNRLLFEFEEKKGRSKSK
jgi:hypothetical protein